MAKHVPLLTSCCLSGKISLWDVKRLALIQDIRIGLHTGNLRNTHPFCWLHLSLTSYQLDLEWKSNVSVHCPVKIVYQVCTGLPVMSKDASKGQKLTREKFCGASWHFRFHNRWGPGTRVSGSRTALTSVGRLVPDHPVLRRRPQYIHFAVCVCTGFQLPVSFYEFTLSYTYYFTAKF